MNAIIEALLQEGKYSCVMAPAPPELADAVMRWGQMFIEDHELYTNPDDPLDLGREKDIHVTCKFGLHEAEPSPELLRIIEETQPFEIEIGPCTLFETNEKFDVVKFDVESDGLRELNRRLSELANSDEHPQYQPHCTVAYVTKGCCHELIGKPLLDPAVEPELRFVVKCVVFSNPDKVKTTLFLGKPNLEEDLGDEEDFKDVYDAPEPNKWEQRIIDQLIKIRERGWVWCYSKDRHLLERLGWTVHPYSHGTILSAIAIKRPANFGHTIWYELRSPPGWDWDNWSAIREVLRRTNLYRLESIINEVLDDDDEMDAEMAKEVTNTENEPKNFTWEDTDIGDYARQHPDADQTLRIYAAREDFIYRPLWWHRQGLQHTAYGYGSKLVSSYCIMFNGKIYRLFTTCYGNSGSTWFRVKRRKIYVS